MGIPKLFRYLTDRYPCLSQILTANQLPEYDYFYIDLNNLIHKARSEKCLLPLEKADEQFLSETRIFERVFRYIETLHRIVPSRVLFLAIDGVAPRAKWTTQRERRFRVAENDDAITSGFDSNAISPGTTFMHNFEKALINFISNQIKCHSNWRNCEIYVSGSNSPGEGSLKIIDFIRSLKQSKSYKSNETHCIYSGDNDYLLLGFATHELYISLMQERKRCPSSLSMLCSDDIKHQFEVIHFEMLRQYLRMEFIDCKTEMSFEFNMDSIVDDWVLLMTLIGNDYVFGLPNFDLELDALSVIYDAYKMVLKSSNGYINESGFLHVRRFARLIQTLRPDDFNLYCKSMQNSISSMNKKLSSINLNNNNNDVETDAENGAEPTFSDFLEMKDQYYMDKLGDEKMPDFVQMSMNYVKTIQWVLFYYFRGTCSWGHSYPFACAPFVSDFTTVHNVTFTLDIDKPAKPFTHLLAILPKKSAHLLPKSYQLMMIDDVQIDLENLTQKTYLAEKNLNTDDEQRNKIKPVIKIQYDGSKSGDVCVRITEISTDKKTDRIDTSKHVQRPFHRDDFNFKFSSLNLHDYSSKLVKQTDSKPITRIIISLNVEHQNDLDAIATKYLNEIVYVNWPHFMEAKVIQVFDVKKKYDSVGGEVNITENPAEFNACVEQLNKRYSEYGIELGEIKMVAYVAPLKWKEYIASEQKPNAFELSKYWDENNWQLVAVQTMSKCFMPEKWPKFKAVSEVLNVTDVFLFSKKSYHFGEMATICDAENVEVNGRVNILSQMKQEPNFEKAIDAHSEAKANKMTHFKQPSTVATILGISEKVLGRITGSVLVSTDNSTDTLKKVNIGLQLKIRSVYQTNMVLLHDYVKTNGKQFLYSQLAIDLIQQYMDKFPLIIELINSSDGNVLLVSDFERNQNNQSALEYLAEICNWLQSLPHSNATRTPLDVIQFSDDALKHVYGAIRDTEAADVKILKLKMKWQNLYIPDLNNVFAVPIPDASYKLLDRIVIVRSGYPVSIGSKGTIIGIVPMRNHIVGNDITENELFALDILMDFPFKIPSAVGKFQQHFIYRTKSTNMLLNISFGRVN